MKKNKDVSYAYLICYGFSREVMVGENTYPECGTGRICLNLTKKIETPEDIQSVESIMVEDLKDEIEGIVSTSLYAFSLLAVIDNHPKKSFLDRFRKKK